MKNGGGKGGRGNRTVAHTRDHALGVPLKKNCTQWLLLLGGTEILYPFD